MLTLTRRQVSSLSVNKFVCVWPLSSGSVAAPARTNVSYAGTSRRVSAHSLRVGGAGGSAGSAGPGTARFAWTYAASGNVLSKPLVLTTVCTLNQQQVQLLSTSSQLFEKAHIDTTAEDGKRERLNPAPHFRETLKKEKKTAEENLAQASVQAAIADETREGKEDGQYLLPHPIWSDGEVTGVEITHRPPKGFVDWFAYSVVQTLRFGFDVLSGYNRGNRTEKKWLIRIIFLETIAGVPGMVAAMTRHLRSLRRMQRDHGWIHTLLEEAENERMHLMTALELRRPGKLFTMAVLFTQGIFVNLFFLAYICSPRFCHRIVGYLEEEAVITYTKLIKDLDDGKLSVWGNMTAPDLAIRYWRLKPDAMMRDMILAIRADEAHHREVNHFLSDLKPDDSNPFPPGQ